MSVSWVKAPWFSPRHGAVSLHKMSAVIVNKCMSHSVELFKDLRFGDLEASNEQFTLRLREVLLSKMRWLEASFS